MAYLLSISFTTPFCYRETQLKGSYARRLTGGVLINPVTGKKPGEKHLMCKYTGGGMISSNGSCHCNISAPTRRCFDPILSHCCVHSTVPTLLSGFWMGPDVEDGWGFVEASVHQIY